MVLSFQRGSGSEAAVDGMCLGNDESNVASVPVFHGPPDRRDWPSTYVHVTVWDRDRFLPDRLIGEVTFKLGGKF